MTPLNDAPNSARTARQILAAPQTPQGGRRQRIRMRRFAFASMFSILFVGVLTVFYAEDKIDGRTLADAALLVFAFIAAFRMLRDCGTVK